MKIGNIECYGVIYKITNKINKKVYIGQTVNGFNRRYIGKGENGERLLNYYKFQEENNRFVNKHLFSSLKYKQI